MREVILTARGVVRYELPDNWLSVGHCCEGVEIVPHSTSPISFVLDVPDYLRLDCESLEVRSREWDEAVPAWFSDRDFFVALRENRLPTPQEWLDALANRGISAAWRYFDGPATPSGEVPPNYDGYVGHLAERYHW